MQIEFKTTDELQEMTEDELLTYVGKLSVARKQIKDKEKKALELADPRELRHHRGRQWLDPPDELPD